MESGTTRSYRSFIVGASLSLLAGLGPLTYALLDASSRPLIVLCSLNWIGWSIVSLLLMKHRHMFINVQSAIDTTGLSDLPGNLTETITRFAYETTRYHRARYAFRVHADTSGADLSQNLWRVVNLAYVELNAQSVELSLFDEESGLWSQGMIIGYPKTTSGQSMLIAGVEDRAPFSVDEGEQGTVISKPVTFAGKLFGALRVELQPGYKLTTSDRHVLHLLAAQGGILLVDARFHEEALRLRRLSDETVRAKTGFLANLSHELRGPLGIILNGVELSMDGLCGEVSDAQREMLRMIKDSGDHLLDLVNDVLDYAKVEAGKISVSPVDMQLKPLLEDLVAVVRTQAMQKDHKVLLEEVDPNLGIICDKRHARQILVNFLTNAIKYTPEGGTITVSASRVPGNRAKLEVKDTGIGIPAKEHHKVFGAFERVDDEYAQKQMGTGLGLSLTKRLSEVNDGSIGFDSEVGEGSRFWVKLPALELDSIEASSNEEDVEDVGPFGKGETVLLVDHDESSRDMLKRYLENQGFITLEGGTGAEVLRVLRKNTIDLAIVENDMPDLPGEEMIAAIRGTPNAASVPIILLSAKAFVFDIERFLKLGVDRCLSKPVSLAELASTCRRLVDESRSLEAKASESAPSN